MIVARHPSMNDRDWRLASVERPFAVKIDGIWRAAQGVYIYPFSPVKIKCIYQGREVILDERHFADCEGCSDNEMEYEIINRNISTFPARPKPKMARLRGVIDNQTPIIEIVAAQPTNWIVIDETLTTPPINPLAG